MPKNNKKPEERSIFSGFLVYSSESFHPFNRGRSGAKTLIKFTPTFDWSMVLSNQFNDSSFFDA